MIITGHRATLIVVSFATACASARPVPQLAELGAPAPPPRWLAPSACEAGGEGLWPGDAALDAVVAEAYDRNLDLIAAASRVDAAAAESRIAGAALEPTVDVQSNGVRRKQVFIGLPVPGSGGPLSSTSTSYGLSLNTAWEVDLWGRLRAGHRAAIAELAAADAELAWARLSLGAQVAKTWYAAIEANEQLALARDTLDSRRATLATARRRFEGGLGAGVELHAAEAAVAGVEALAAARASALAAVRRQLEMLLGRYPGGVIATPSALPGVECVVPSQLPAEMIHRRPDLQAAERRLVASSSRVEVAEGALRPSFRLTAGGGTTSEQLRDLVDGDFSVWSVFAGLFQPLFAGGRLRAGVDRARAGELGAAYGYAAAVLAAYGEVEAALASERYLSQQEASLGRAAVEESATVRALDERYREGLLDVLSLRESQRRELEARSRLLEVRGQRLRNRIDLYLSLGGEAAPVGAAGREEEGRS